MMVYSALYTSNAHLSPRYGDFKVVSDPAELVAPGILILHGGEDIGTAIYNQEPGAYTYRRDPSLRDRKEMELVKRAVELDIGIFGICRGAQLLTAMAGGSLIQDVTKHGSDHTIDTNDGQRFIVTSAHHQMCNPHGTEHELIAWSTTNLSRHYKGEGDVDVYMPIEPEVIFYPKLKALAVQPHPEWMSIDSEFVQYLFKLIEEKLLCLQ